MSQVSFARRGRRTLVALLLAALVGAVSIAILAPGASADTGTTGPVSVTITPTTNLTDGQPISVTGTLATPGFFEIRAHICVAGTGAALSPGDTFDFGYQGTFCSKTAPGAGDREQVQAYSGAETTASLTFKAGVTGPGGVTWQDEDTAATHTLNCDATHACELVVQFQTSQAGGPYYFSSPLHFAAPATNPGPVTGVTATPGNGQVNVNWTAPASDGNSPIDQYVVSQDGVALPPVAAPATSLLVTGLTNGTPYTFSVQAHNAAGFTSLPPDPSATATPSLAFKNVQQPITVTRPAGDLVLTQACSPTGANPYPDDTLVPGNYTTPPGPVTYGAATQGGCTVALGSAKLIKAGNGAGQFFGATGAMNEVTVVDGRDTDPGWSAQGSVSQFDLVAPLASQPAHFSGNDLGWAPTRTDTGPLSSDDGSYDQTVVAGGLVTPKVTGAGITPGVGLGSAPATLGSAVAGSGLGIARLNAALTLYIPINAKSGDYQSLLTITVA